MMTATAIPVTTVLHVQMVLMDSLVTVLLVHLVTTAALIPTNVLLIPVATTLLVSMVLELTTVIALHYFMAVDVSTRSFKYLTCVILVLVTTEELVALGEIILLAFVQLVLQAQPVMMWLSTKGDAWGILVTMDQYAPKLEKGLYAPVLLDLLVLTAVSLSTTVSWNYVVMELPVKQDIMDPITVCVLLAIRESIAQKYCLPANQIPATTMEHAVLPQIIPTRVSAANTSLVTTVNLQFSHQIIAPMACANLVTVHQVRHSTRAPVLTVTEELTATL